MNPGIETKLKETADIIEKALINYLGAEYAGGSVVADAMRYSTLGGGKRIRAFLVLEFCRMFGGDEKSAIPFACALECVHAYSLIHDDLPCMDDDDMRRGKPSCHVKFGYAEALLAGDGLLTAAFDILSSNESVSDKSVRLAVKALAHEAGAVGMVGGQAFDMAKDVDSYDDLKKIYIGKTSALIEAACLLGYYAATDKVNEAVIADIHTYAENLGIAFQIHDDILDVKSDAETLGKPIGSDDRNGKKTSLKFFTLDEAEAEEERLTKEAIGAISTYENSETAVELAGWLMTRMK